MKKGSKKLQKFEQFREEEVDVIIDKERLTNLIGMALPILDEISKIIDVEDIPGIFHERVKDSMEVLDDLKKMY